VIRAILEIQAHRVLRVLQALKAPQERLVLKVLKETLVLLAQQVLTLR
jgi:hypothetical protein